MSAYGAVSTSAGGEARNGAGDFDQLKYRIECYLSAQ
jgi:hypothetical protein